MATSGALQAKPVDSEAGSEKPVGRSAFHLSARNVTVRFGQVVALDGFTADIPRGTVGLLGPNGAGKSTFIKAALGLLQPESGSIQVGGLDSQSQSLQIRDDVGYMPEHDCLLPSMNAVELVSYLAQISGMGPRDAMQRGHEVLDFVGINEERYRLVRSYSTGMKQKVKLAQAIVHDPALLFLDEPTSGMDPQGREEMLDLVRKIGSSDKTVIVSSHILQEVERVCDFVVIISNGKLVRSGETRALVAGEEGVQALTVRGDDAAIAAYVKAIGEICEIMQRGEEGRGQASLLLRGCGNGKAVFRLARDSGVQIRNYRPERLDLEEVFLRAFKGGAKDGS
ncbi:MAG TPA: ABC transporter ATP-binding protein [Thermoplasmata archaeon]|nr:ABC transporter ATP-binding protein [Thermoplasmata archaeon]